MEKKTVLNEDANIYKKNRDTFNKSNWNELSGKQKRQYFMDYYLKFVILGIVLLALAGYFIYTGFFNKVDSLLSVSMVDETDTFHSEQLQEDLQKSLGITDKKQEVTVSSLYSTGLYADSTMFTKLSAGTIDILIMDKDAFEKYSAMGAFIDLSTILTDAQLTNLEGTLAKGRIKEYDEKGNVIREDDEKVYGIDLTTNSKYQSFNPSLSSSIIALISTSKNQENAKKALEYFIQP